MSANPVQRLGDFEILSELGRGGMGVVYEARQRSLNRKVALKVLASTLGLTSHAVERFQREAEAAGKLHHTNIVPVYATGEEDGIHFYAMELIPGPSLDRVIKQMRQREDGSEQPTVPGAPDLAATGPYVEQSSSGSGTLSSSSLGSGGAYFDAVARMVAEVADALEHAHKQKVIHRDVKPSNLLLSPEGRLSLNDFGLARMLEQPGMTMTGEFVGTPSYMSPEQITSGRIPVDHRTDIYSLGATLYELLTLRAPFVGDSRDRVLAQIIQKDPTPPRSLNKRVPRDLETICLKAMEKDPDKRYQTAGQMADDLRRYVNRFAILAKRPSVVERCGKWVRRHPGLTAGVACAVLGLGVAGFFAWHAHEAERLRVEQERDQAERLAAETRKQEERLLAEQRQNALDLALVAATGGDLRAAQKAIAKAELLGASTGQVHVLQGQVALHSGKTQDALDHLKQAVNLLPDSVMARGMLAVAYAYNGEWNQYIQTVEKMQLLTPRTPEDWLFKGYAEGQHDPALGLRTLERAMSERPMMIAYLLRAELRFWHAQDTGDLATAQMAVQDADFVRKSLPQNPIAIWVSLEAWLVQAGVHERSGRIDKQDEAMKQAGSFAEALKAYPDNPDAVSYRWYYMREIGALNDFLPELETASGKSSHVYLSYCYALTLYQTKDFNRTVTALSKQESSLSSCLRPFAIAEEQKDDWKTRALAAHRDHANRFKDDGWTLLNGQTALRFIEEKEQAIRVCRELQTHPERFPLLRRAVLLKILDYNCGDIDLRELEQTVNATLSLWDQCVMHYYVGMKYLSEGNRDEARDHFSKAVATRAFNFSEYDMSFVFLARLKKDHNWPRWIEQKK